MSKLQEIVLSVFYL